MEYVIRLVNDAAEESPVKALSGVNSEGVGGETASAPTKGEAFAQKLAKRFIGPAVVVSTVDQIISHQHSVISLTTGAREYGQRAAYGYQKTSSFIKSVAMGALAGNMAVPGVGAIAGGLSTALLNGIGFGMEYLFQNDVIEKQKDLEDISLRMQRTRATVSGRRYSNVTEF